MQYPITLVYIMVSPLIHFLRFNNAFVVTDPFIQTTYKISIRTYGSYSYHQTHIHPTPTISPHIKYRLWTKIKHQPVDLGRTWWRHLMKTLCALLAICAGNSSVTGEFPHKGQWPRTLMFSLIYAWIYGWVNNGEAGDLRRHRVITLMDKVEV